MSASDWQEHVTTALLGTGRRPVPALPGIPEAAGDTAGDTAGDVPGDTAGDDPAGRLLDQAALLTVRRRAGASPAAGADVEPVAPAPPETAPAVPAAAGRRLAQILGGDRLRLLPEWLDFAAGRGLRVPARLLPELLDRGRSDRALRPSIARAAGRRGVWLALRNTDWAYLISQSADPGDDPDVWQTGTRNQRLAHLLRLRETDPPAALAALRETWSSEPAPDRAAFLGTLRHGLSAADEEFLEAALDDRGKDVRQLAADLLAELPATAYGRRMAARGRGCLRPERRTVRMREQTWIVVDPPHGHDEDMARDGIPYYGGYRADRPGPPVGARGGWLREILARTPLATWTELFGLPAMEVVCMPIADSRDRPAGPGEPDAHSAKGVHVGWARAAVRQRDAEWARALLKGGIVVDEPEVLADLLGALPAAERDAAGADLIRWVEGYPDLLRVLERIPGPWTGELADAVVATIAGLPEVVGDPYRFQRGANRHEHDVSMLCRLADERLTPDAAPRLEEIAGRHPDAWPLAELTETLRFRHEMLKELS